MINQLIIIMLLVANYGLIPIFTLQGKGRLCFCQVGILEHTQYLVF